MALEGCKRFIGSPGYRRGRGGERVGFSGVVESLETVKEEGVSLFSSVEVDR